ncbi:MAG: hypothetical protein A2Z43_08460 [Syntrophobacterales bacterium RBG_19FT_COMBO_59_10]|nr:MAG: hypothetical protein A2Z43_08460 [Syntrophobacterales bacterium RBG_19FT_COMBO_59_10]
MIIRFLVAIVVIYLLYLLLRKGFFAAGRKSGAAGPKPPAIGEELIEDPLCHTYVPMSHACRASIDGKAVYFCSQKCLERYIKEKKVS